MRISRYYFFDLDGTLADTDPDIRVSWKAAMRDLGLENPNFDRDFVAGPPIDVMLQQLFPNEYTPELAAKMRERFGSHYDNDGFPNTKEYPGVIERAKVLKALGAHLYIVTNKRHAGASKMMAHFGWDKVFEKLYTGDMFGVKKPELIALILRTEGIDPKDVVMVGDTRNDFAAAKANGVRSLGVTWGYGKPDELKEANSTTSKPEEIQ